MPGFVPRGGRRQFAVHTAAHAIHITSLHFLRSRSRPETREPPSTLHLHNRSARNAHVRRALPMPLSVPSSCRQLSLWPRRPGM
eukprot:scaffold189_cov118-Isochrysis_galbana.AAC.8